MEYLHPVFEVGECDEDRSASLHLWALHHPDRSLNADLPGDVENVMDDVLHSAGQGVTRLILRGGDPIKDQVVLFTNLKVIHLLLYCLNHTGRRLNFVLKSQDTVAKLREFFLHF